MANAVVCCMCSHSAAGRTAVATATDSSNSSTRQQQQQQERCTNGRSHLPASPQLPPLLLLLLLAAVAVAQQPMPLMGNGDQPPSVPVTVYVSTFVDRVLAVGDKAYDFEVVRDRAAASSSSSSSVEHSILTAMLLAAAAAATGILLWQQPLLRQISSHITQSRSRSRFLLGSLATLLLVLLPAAAQQSMPFQGSGDAAPAVPVNVYVSVFVDRLLAVDDRTYEFRAVVWFYLSWTDPRAKSQLAANAAKLTANNSNTTCTLPCNSNQKAIAGGCCDGVWMPYIAFSNLKYLPQDRVIRYGFGVVQDSDAVFQWRSVHAIYYTPMDLRAFPFDRQQLLIQMEVPQARTGWSGGLVNLIPSTTGNKMFTAKTRGDDVSGWGVVDVRLQPFEYPLCEATTAGALEPSAADDPAPVIPQYIWDSQARRDPRQCAAVLESDPKRGRLSPFWRNTLHDSKDVPSEPVPVSGLNCVIVVQRFTTRWVLSAIFPIMATTWLSFLVFFLPRDDMNGRLGSIVALFLALAAIQFVIDSDIPSSSYITPLQQLTLASYVSLVFVGIECCFIWWITTYHVEKRRLRRHQEALEHYEARLAAVRAAINAWLAKAQDGLGGGAAAAGAAPSSSASRSSISKKSKMFGKFVTGRNIPSGEGHLQSLPQTGPEVTAVAGPRVTTADDRQVSLDASAHKGGVGSHTAAAAGIEPSPKVPDHRSGILGDHINSSKPVSLVTASETDGTSGDVRLVVAPEPQQQQQQQMAVQQGISLQSGLQNLQTPESFALADAAAAAAVAAAELARMDAAAAAADTSQRRPGIVRFLSHKSNQRLTDASTAALLAQPDQAAAAAAEARILAEPPSAAIHVDQIVQQLLAAQGKDLPGSNPAAAAQRPGAALQTGASSSGSFKRGSAAAADDDDKEPVGRFKALHVFLESFGSDDAFADRVAHLANKWCAIVQLLMYNAAAIMVFVINSQLFHVE